MARKSESRSGNFYTSAVRSIADGGYDNRPNIRFNGRRWLRCLDRDTKQSIVIAKIAIVLIRKEKTIWSGFSAGIHRERLA
jgi:hypothetical protein